LVFEPEAMISFRHSIKKSSIYFCFDFDFSLVLIKINKFLSCLEKNLAIKRNIFLRFNIFLILVFKTVWTWY